MRKDILKTPLTKRELKKMFMSGTLPAILEENNCYFSSDIRNFYTGQNSSVLQSENETVNRVTTKKVIFQSMNISLPSRTNNRLISNWVVGNIDNFVKPIVIILNVNEYIDGAKGFANYQYILIGIFNISEFKKILVDGDNSLNRSNWQFCDFTLLDIKDYKSEETMGNRYCEDYENNSYNKTETPEEENLIVDKRDKLLESLMGGEEENTGSDSDHISKNSYEVRTERYEEDKKLTTIEEVIKERDEKLSDSFIDDIEVIDNPENYDNIVGSDISLIEDSNGEHKIQNDSIYFNIKGGSN